MDIYVASAYSNREAVRLMMGLLRSEGHNISHDWTHEKATPMFMERQEVRNEVGFKDYQGVLECDVLVVLAHPDARDTRFEMGLAVGLQKPVVVVSPDSWSTVFLDARLGVETVEAMVDVLPKLQELESLWYDNSSEIVIPRVARS